MSEYLDDKNGGTTIRVFIPPELVALGCAPDFQRFFDAMVYKMRRNAHKGRWEDVPLAKALEEVREETAELADAIENGSSSEILMEAADVANWALILANIGLEAVEPVAITQTKVDIADRLKQIVHEETQCNCGAAALQLHALWCRSVNPDV